MKKTKKIRSKKRCKGGGVGFSRVKRNVKKDDSEWSSTGIYK